MKLNYLKLNKNGIPLFHDNEQITIFLIIMKNKQKLKTREKTNNHAEYIDVEKKNRNKKFHLKKWKCPNQGMR